VKQISVERSIWINAPRERVWRAVTRSDQIMRWWGGDFWEISALEVGAPVKFGDPDNPIVASVAAVIPPSEFALQWPPLPQNHFTAMLTTFRLAEEGGGTRVTVVEAGYEGLPDDIRQRRLDSTTNGYETVLASLKAYVEHNTAGAAADLRGAG
jgi:uncharacterized protein YndB with AHSA1/START domain